MSSESENDLNNSSLIMVNTTISPSSKSGTSLSSPEVTALPSRPPFRKQLSKDLRGEKTLRKDLKTLLYVTTGETKGRRPNPFAGNVETQRREYPPKVRLNDFAYESDIDRNLLPQISINRNTGTAWEQLRYPCDLETGAKLVEMIRKSGRIGAAEKISIGSDASLKLFGDSSRSKLLEDVRQHLGPKCASISAKIDTISVRLASSEEKFGFSLNSVNMNMVSGKDLDDLDQAKKRPFGTMIVYLPSRYQGGQLSVRNPNNDLEIRRFDFNSKETDPLGCGVVAFFSECLFEIAPITDGCLVTLEYKLFYEGNEIPKPPPSYSDLERGILDLISNAWCLPQFSDKTVGILVQHRYPVFAPMKPGMLKGVDRVVFQTLKSASSKQGDQPKFDVELAKMTCSITGGDEEYARVADAEDMFLGILDQYSEHDGLYNLYIDRFDETVVIDGTQAKPEGKLAQWRSYRNDWEDSSPVRFLNEAGDFYATGELTRSFSSDAGRVGAARFEIQYNTYAILIKKRLL